jgi:hypothetical protein
MQALRRAGRIRVSCGRASRGRQPRTTALLRALGCGGSLLPLEAALCAAHDARG